MKNNKNYINEEKEFYVTRKEIFINSFMGRCKFLLFISYRN